MKLQIVLFLILPAPLAKMKSITKNKNTVNGEISGKQFSMTTEKFYIEDPIKQEVFKK